MKARYQIKEDAKELIKTNNLWLSIGLIQTILGILTISVYLNDTHNLTVILPSAISALFEIALSVYLIDVIQGKTEIKSGFMNQTKDIINSLKTKSLISYLISNVYTFLWALIPFAGIILVFIKSYSYGLTIYIASINENNPNLTANDCITESKYKMIGHKLTWFIQNLSFIPWLLLTVITGGLANIYVYPYMTAADVIFANQVLEENKKKGH